MCGTQSPLEASASNARGVERGSLASLSRQGSDVSLDQEEEEEVLRVQQPHQVMGVPAAREPHGATPTEGANAAPAASRKGVVGAGAPPFVFAGRPAGPTASSAHPGSPPSKPPRIEQPRPTAAPPQQPKLNAAPSPSGRRLQRRAAASRLRPAALHRRRPAGAKLGSRGLRSQTTGHVAPQKSTRPGPLCRHLDLEAMAQGIFHLQTSLIAAKGSRATTTTTPTSTTTSTSATFRFCDPS
eukprot:GHVT01020379.1.p1 GENE.GHVT01020379.1~~GHVT01020379.1.p1  ORF type:complete len:241 (+),score=47.55 GHVT01020379.1:75-797(+)